MLVLVYREFVVADDDVVVLHLVVCAHTQRVVPGKVVALPHQEQSLLPRVQQLLRLFPLQSAMEPPGEGGQRGGEGRWSSGTDVMPDSEFYLVDSGQSTQWTVVSLPSDQPTQCSLLNGHCLVDDLLSEQCSVYSVVSLLSGQSTLWSFDSG